MIPTLAITLPRSAERRANLRNEMARVDISFEYIYGVDGSLLKAPDYYGDLREEFPEYLPARLEDIPLRPGETGCYLSFIRALRRAIDLDADNVLIVEDDVCFSFENKDILDHLARIDLSWDQLKLSYTYYPLNRGIWVGRRILMGEKYDFYFYWRGIIGTTCNLYTRAGLRKLLKGSSRFGMCKPIDSLISNYRYRMDFLPVFVRPSLAGESESLRSVIIPDRDNRSALKNYLHKQKFSQRKLRQFRYIVADLRHPLRALVNWVKKAKFIWYCCKYLLWRRKQKRPARPGTL